MQEENHIEACEHYVQLAALSTAEGLSACERAALERHLLECGHCRAVYEQYRILARDGFAALAGYETSEAKGSWDSAAGRRKLLARISKLESAPAHRPLTPRRRWRLAAAGLAACLLVGATASALRLHASGENRARLAEASARIQLEAALAATKTTDAKLDAQNEMLGNLQAENSRRLRETEQLRERLRDADQKLDGERALARQQSEEADAFLVRESSAKEQIRSLTLERDLLSSHLRNAFKATESTNDELAALRIERRAWLREQSELESRVRDLNAANRDQERRLDDSEQFLSSDRDIRELMGARNLYIADVFDVDSSSRTRKPFGRVFYTRGKSLVFYAFDLDRQPRLKTKSSFQVWGEKETAQTERAPVTNLGILYLDSESNRRWIMRYDDPKTLAEIDAVFVTVEPQGGSAKPTGKPFLFAMLLKHANHP